MVVSKRNGNKVEFNLDKIKVAVAKAIKEVRPNSQTTDKDADDISLKVYNRLSKKEDVSVEEIQDIVEHELMKSGLKDVAKAYITYRYLHGLIRESNTTDKSIKELIDGENEYWNTENSNKNPRVVTTQRDYIAGITSTDISRRFLLPRDVVEAHDEGIIHFHKNVVA